MKILTKEEEQAHYNATLKGGFIGGITGLALVRAFKPSHAGLYETPYTNEARIDNPQRAVQRSMAHISASTASASSLSL